MSVSELTAQGEAENLVAGSFFLPAATDHSPLPCNDIKPHLSLEPHTEQSSGLSSLPHPTACGGRTASTAAATGSIPDGYAPAAVGPQPGNSPALSPAWDSAGSLVISAQILQPLPTPTGMGTAPQTLVEPESGAVTAEDSSAQSTEGGILEGTEPMETQPSREKEQDLLLLPGYPRPSHEDPTPVAAHRSGDSPQGTGLSSSEPQRFAADAEASPFCALPAAPPIPSGAAERPEKASPGCLEGQREQPSAPASEAGADAIAEAAGVLQTLADLGQSGGEGGNTGGSRTSARKRKRGAVASSSGAVARLADTAQRSEAAVVHDIPKVMQVRNLLPGYLRTPFTA